MIALDEAVLGSRLTKGEARLLETWAEQHYRAAAQPRAWPADLRRDRQT